MEKPKKRLKLSDAWRDAKDLIWAHRSRLADRHGLMLVNRLMGLVLPASSKYLVDEVIGKGRADLLSTLALAAGAATLVQADQLVSPFLKSWASPRSAPSRRCAKACRITSRACLYATSTRRKQGQLISRIMTDAEGIRNLVGTGIAQLVGGLCHRQPCARRALLHQLASDLNHPRRVVDFRRLYGVRL
ncbi:MAG: hypothetical protein WKF84_06020 [Pyrinomonadaceae bacterium]